MSTATSITRAPPYFTEDELEVAVVVEDVALVVVVIRVLEVV